MRINVKCYANLPNNTGCNFREPTALEISDRAMIKGVLSQMAVDADAVHLVYVNGRKAALGDALAEGDRLGLFPAVAGM